MKLTALLFAASLAGNALLVGLFFSRPFLAPPALREFFTTDADRAARAADESRAIRARVAERERLATRQRARTWETLQTEDLPTLVARLRAAGFSPVVVRAVVGARLESAFSTRMNDLLGTLGDTPFWKPEPFSSMSNPRFYEAYNQLYRDRAKALRELLGDDYFASGGGDATAAQRRQFGDLPKAKIDLVQRIVDDYAEMAAQIRSASQGIMLPEDREKLALLEREKRADLATILSASELADYEMRNATVTQRLRTALTLMDANDVEFRAIYGALQPLAEILFPETRSGPITFTQDMMQQRQQAQEKANTQLKTALGDQRFADYQRSSNYDFQQLARLAQRENVASEAVIRAFDLRLAIAEESMRINTAQLPTAERAAALQQLAGKAKSQLTAALGPNVATAYAAAATWVTALERGWSIRIMPDGQMSYTGPPQPGRPGSP